MMENNLNKSIIVQHNNTIYIYKIKDFEYFTKSENNQYFYIDIVTSKERIHLKFKTEKERDVVFNRIFNAIKSYYNALVYEQ